MSSRGSWRDPETRGHEGGKKEVSLALRDQRQRRSEGSPIQSERREEVPWKTVGTTGEEEGERYWEAPGRGRREKARGERRNC